MGQVEAEWSAEYGVAPSASRVAGKLPSMVYHSDWAIPQ